ncbi:MAG: hypothetical protein H6Q58_2353 [Firmicutes bacterium]|nr:hypothetical protein [Bacillota bacterium]
MAIKNCIFTENKICDNCGDCETCDLSPLKICDNCGKCLGGEGDYASKAVEIDEIIEGDYFEEPEQYSGEAGEEKAAEIDEGLEEELEVELIDDIEGLRELLENKAHSEKYTKEEFPGFIRFKVDGNK